MTDTTRAAARLRPWLTGLCLGLAVVLIGERAGYAGAYAGVPATELPGRLLVQFVLALPAALYLAGLWQLRGAVAAAAGGATFGPAIVAALRRTGFLLVAGALATILLMPALHRLLGEPYARLIDFDVATLVLAALGAVLAFIARLLERAAGVEAELDAIF